MLDFYDLFMLTQNYTHAWLRDLPVRGPISPTGEQPEAPTKGKSSRKDVARKFSASFAKNGLASVNKNVKSWGFLFMRIYKIWIFAEGNLKNVDFYTRKFYKLGLTEGNCKSLSFY